MRTIAYSRANAKARIAFVPLLRRAFAERIKQARGALWRRLGIRSIASRSRPWMTDSSGRSRLTRVTPALPVFPHRLGHRLCIGFQLASGQLLQMSPDFLHRAAAAEVDVCRLPAHSKKQAAFIPILWQDLEFNARTMRREPPHNPSSSYLHKRIGR